MGLLVLKDDAEEEALACEDYLEEMDLAYLACEAEALVCLARMEEVSDRLAYVAVVLVDQAHMAGVLACLVHVMEALAYLGRAEMVLDCEGHEVAWDLAYQDDEVVEVWVCVHHREADDADDADDAVEDIEHLVHIFHSNFHLYSIEITQQQLLFHQLLCFLQ